MEDDKLYVITTLMSIKDNAKAVSDFLLDLKHLICTKYCKYPEQLKDDPELRQDTCGMCPFSQV